MYIGMCVWYHVVFRIALPPSAGPVFQLQTQIQGESLTASPDSGPHPSAQRGRSTRRDRSTKATQGETGQFPKGNGGCSLVISSQGRISPTNHKHRLTLCLSVGSGRAACRMLWLGSTHEVTLSVCRLKARASLSQGWLVGAECGGEASGPTHGSVLMTRLRPLSEQSKIHKGRRSRILYTLILEVTGTITHAMSCGHTVQPHSV